MTKVDQISSRSAISLSLVTHAQDQHHLIYALVDLFVWNQLTSVGIIPGLNMSYATSIKLLQGPTESCASGETSKFCIESHCVLILVTAVITSDWSQQLLF